MLHGPDDRVESVGTNNSTDSAVADNVREDIGTGTQDFGKALQEATSKSDSNVVADQFDGENAFEVVGDLAEPQKPEVTHEETSDGTNYTRTVENGEEVVTFEDGMVVRSTPDGENGLTEVGTGPEEHHNFTTNTRVEADGTVVVENTSAAEAGSYNLRQTADSTTIEYGDGRRMEISADQTEFTSTGPNDRDNYVAQRDEQGLEVTYENGDGFMRRPDGTYQAWGDGWDDHFGTDSAGQQTPSSGIRGWIDRGRDIRHSDDQITEALIERADAQADSASSMRTIIELR